MHWVWESPRPADEVESAIRERQPRLWELEYHVLAWGKGTQKEGRSLVMLYGGRRGCTVTVYVPAGLTLFVWLMALGLIAAFTAMAAGEGSGRGAGAAMGTLARSPFLAAILWESRTTWRLLRDIACVMGEKARRCSRFRPPPPED